jgi:DNA-binding PucR family transcriptional regulator
MVAGRPAELRYARMAAVSAEIFLELLARDASPVEFERPVLDARAEGADPQIVAGLDRAKVLALSISSTLRTHRRREAELSALFETANDLTALTKVDDVLEAIVRRARQLLGRDVTYLTLNDEERGDTYMRITNGSTSAEFQALRLPMGAGLGGLVAQTAKPYATTEYLKDERYRHTDAIDSGVQDEGLVSILGVPLRLGSRVIGVLYAADRRPRPFAHEEVALLSSLAAHAVVALDNARLLTETRHALHELEEVNARLQNTTVSMQRAAEAHDRLTELVLRGGGVDDVVRELAAVLGGGDVFVLDSDLRPFAASGTPANQEMGGDVEEHAAQALEAGRLVVRGDRSLVPVVAGTEGLGFLGVRRDRDLDDAERRILERGAQVTALLLLFRRTVAEAELRGHRELVDDLLTARSHDWENLAERARLLGADLDRDQVVVVVHTDSEKPNIGQVAAFTAGAAGGLVSRLEGRLVFLLPGDDAGSVAHSVRADLARTLGATVTAASAPCGADLAAIPQAYNQACRCLDALLALGREGDASAVTELGFFGLLLGGDQDVPAYVRATIGSVLDYDRRRGTDLVSTLGAYFAHGGNLARTGKELNVHTNTVSQRLGRIGQLLGEGWQEPERALEIHLALRLHRLVGG